MQPDAALDAGALRRLARMAPQRLDASRPAAIKRNVHSFEVDVAAPRLAAALRAVMIDPGASFGLVRLRRDAARVGRDFTVGERFQGCFSVRRAAAAAGAPRWVLAALEAAARAGVLAWIENRLTADHAELVELADDRVTYRYLDGTPLAGTSSYAIVALAAGRCRVDVTFCYQETTAAALTLLHRFGIRQHDLAVLAQLQAAAARAGGRVLSATLVPGRTPAPTGAPTAPPRSRPGVAAPPRRS